MLGLLDAVGLSWPIVNQQINFTFWLEVGNNCFFSLSLIMPVNIVTVACGHIVRYIILIQGQGYGVSQRLLILLSCLRRRKSKERHLLLLCLMSLKALVIFDSVKHSRSVMA